MVYIRTDANREIGMGHLMRCLTIGKAISEAGENVIYLISDEESESSLKSAGAVYKVLSAKWDCLSADEADAIRSITDDGYSRDRKIPVILVDSYHLTEGYLAALRKFALVAFIDDFLEDSKDADLLINYDVLGRKERADALYDGTYTRLLVGTLYAPLREQFFNVAKRDRFYSKDSGPCSVLLSGGGGAASFLPKIAEHILSGGEAEKIKINAVVGEYADAYAKLLDMEKRYPGRLTVLKNVAGMRSLMEECSIAVTAAGTVPYECCAAALPAVLYSISDDQLPDARWLSENRIMFYAGDIRDGMEPVLLKISEYLSELMASEKLQKEMSERSRQIIDGKGAVRIAAAMLRLREMGSFFEITGGRREKKACNIFRFLEDAAASRTVRFYDSGRSAFAAALDAAKKNSPDGSKRCLLPIYTCDTVILPFEEKGWDISYYHVNLELEPDADEIMKLTEQVKPSAVLFHTYYGMDTLDKMAECIRSLRERGVTVMEDMTQSVFMTGKAVERSDYVVGSLRKWMEIPDGGFSAAALPTGETASEFDGGAFTKKRMDAMTEKGEYLLGHENAIKSSFLRTNTGSEEDRYDDFKAAYSMS
ncbi:MAG: hypothetical protein K6G58_10215, partial [Lachnospiraceae bacterium]|nr:hypothetical protein [Lachnospiraceae bacterium]